MMNDMPMNLPDPSGKRDKPAIGLLLRLRAWRALRAYKKALPDYEWYEREFDALENQRLNLCTSHMAAQETGDDIDEEAFMAEWVRINQRFAELGDPSLKALNRVKAAKARCEKVLQHGDMVV